MRIVIIGATGTIGSAIVAELGPRHALRLASRTSADLQVDISDYYSIARMFEKVKSIDAVILATGNVHFATLMEMTSDAYDIGLKSKLMGQVNVVLLGKDYLNDNGSFTLTSGVLNRDPIRCGSSAAMVNGAIEGFVKSAALEMPRGIRINCVSPTVISEAMKDYAAYFRGFESVPAARAALAYSKSVEGVQTGQVYCVG